MPCYDGPMRKPMCRIHHPDKHEMRKRICIATMFGTPNFGTNLQAYALQHFLERQGYSTRLLDSVPYEANLAGIVWHLVSDWKLYHFWNRLKAFLHGARPPFKPNPRLRRWALRNLYSVKVAFPCQVRRLVENTDCFLAGSDQIWNTHLGANPTMFLAFAKGKKKISYASSIGTGDIHPAHAEKVKKWLLGYQHIGVREASAVVALSALTGRKDIVSVLDPTFLLLPQDWRLFAQLASLPKTVKQPYVFCYLIGTNSHYGKQVLDVLERTGIRDVVLIPACENADFYVEGASVVRNATPPEFVRLLMDADFVCTDSFHATALSINLSKPFVEFMRFDNTDPASQNSRIFDLLGSFGLSERVYDAESNRWAKAIVYSVAQERLNKARASSIRFLEDSIEN